MVKMGGLGIPVVWIPRNLQGLSSSMIQVTTNDGHFRMNLVLWWFLSTERSDSRERILVAWKPWRPRRRKNNTARRNGLALGSHGFFDSLTCFSKHFFNLSTATIHDNRKGPVARKKTTTTKNEMNFPSTSYYRLAMAPTIFVDDPSRSLHRRATHWYQSQPPQ